MKSSFLVVALCLFMAPMAMAGFGRSSKSISNQVFSGKRHMEGEKALANYKKAISGKGVSKEEEIGKDIFFKNYKRLFSKIFAKDASGKVIQFRELNDSGKWVSLIDKNVKIKPATAQEAWDYLEFADEFLLLDSRTETCGFCDGARYVIYFPEELAAYKAHHKKNHKKHDFRNISFSDYKYYSEYDSKRESAKKEYDRLVEKALEFDWEELREHLKITPPKTSSSSSTFYGQENIYFPCCWSELHESDGKKFRHMCPVCKGKKKLPVKRIIRFAINKE